MYIFALLYRQVKEENALNFLSLIFSWLLQKFDA